MMSIRVQRLSSSVEGKLSVNLGLYQLSTPRLLLAWILMVGNRYVFLYFLFIFCYHGSLTVSISISHYSFLYLKGHLVFTFLVICCFGQIRSFLKIGICDYIIGKCRRKMLFFFQENLGLLKPRKLVQKFLCACAL